MTTPLSLKDIPVEVLSQHIHLDVPRCGEIKRRALVLDEQHLLAERIYTLTLLSLTSKEFNNKLKEEKNKLTVQLTKGLEKKNLRFTVEVGWYLFSLRIYYFNNPQALHNKREEVKKNTKGSLPPINWDNIKMGKRFLGSSGTILHNAVYSPNGIRATSVPFISFVLKMDKEHRLGLLEAKDKEGKTPFELVEKIEGLKGLWSEAENNKKEEIKNLIKT